MVAPPRQPVFFVQPVAVLVEGKDEEEFVNALLKHRGFPNGFQVTEYGGGDCLPTVLASFRANRHDPNRALVVVRDAEESFASTFQSVAGALRAKGFVSPSQAGTLADGDPATGVWIMPNNRDAGALEDLCWQAISTKSDADCITTMVDCVQRKGSDLTRSSRAKAQVRAWLACHGKRAEDRLGLCAQQGVLDVNHAAFDAFTLFLRRALAPHAVIESAPANRPEPPA
ncbi:MAG: hypothetical protein HY719_02870 [Planctomycetes bacterium]|nr:hypothetical protein [Planctomycetota bacterium]